MTHASQLTYCTGDLFLMTPEQIAEAQERIRAEFSPGQPSPARYRISQEASRERAIGKRAEIFWPEDDEE